MAEIGKLTVDLRLNSQKFNGGLKKATASLHTFRARTQAATASMGGMQARIAGLVGVAGFGAMIKGSLDSGDALVKMSDRLGISTEKLAAFQHLTQLNGESSESFGKSLEKMTRTIGEAERGLGTGINAFEDLGISIDDFAGKNADEQFLLISESIAGLENKTLQASIASDIFGRSGIKLLNTINQGRAGFEEAELEVKKYGLALSRVDGAKIEAANDAILRAKQVMKGASLQATVQLAPIIEEVAKHFVSAGTEGEGFAGKVKSAIRSSIGVIGVFADGIRGIKVILKAVELGVVGFGALFANVFSFIVNDVLVPFANSVSNFVLAPIREILEFGARFSSTAQEMLVSINALGKAEGFDVLTNVAGKMRESLESTKEELQALMLETIPSEAMLLKLDEIYIKATENGKKVAEKVSSQSNTENEGKKPSEELAEKKSYLERAGNLEIQGSKKVARIKQGIKLKEVLANSFKAISEAVASAPFPANLLPIAFATAESAVAIQGVKSAGSFEGGGYTGSGPRVGGTDGRGGMNATVHPNETIVDQNKMNSQAMQANMNITINGNPNDDVMAQLDRQRKKFGRMVQQVMKTPF